MMAVEVDDDDEDVDKTKTPMGKLDALRVLPEIAKAIAKKKYVEHGRGFSLFKFFFLDECEDHNLGFNVCHQTLSQFSSQSASESTFSSHSYLRTIYAIAYHPSTSRRSCFATVTTSLFFRVSARLSWLILRVLS